MEFVIPEGAQVRITIGGAPWLALPNGSVPAGVATPAVPPARRGHTLLKGAVAVVLLLGAFETGRYVSTRTGPVEPAQAALIAPRPAPAAGAEPAFPDHPLPRPTAAAPSPTEIPPAFRQQLAQPPRVTPPPGQSSARTGSAAPGRASVNPFGLHE